MTSEGPACRYLTTPSTSTVIKRAVQQPGAPLTRLILLVCWAGRQVAFFWCIMHIFAWSSAIGLGSAQPCKHAHQRTCPCERVSVSLITYTRCIHVHTRWILLLVFLIDQFSSILIFRFILERTFDGFREYNVSNVSLLRSELQIFQLVQI